jgi:2-dehydro-3-deoxyphosphogluconate aldolase/(4S)-4-hydroxy-2-oxoglutarate aldolase
MASKLLNKLQEDKIVAILRGITGETGLSAVRALNDAGVGFVEFTLNTDGALGLISKSREEAGDRMNIGAGTVLDIGQAKEAIAAGAQYLISPCLDEEVIYYGAEQGIDVWPGVMTPTEIVKAYKAGATAVKLFPFASLGIAYLKEVRAPLSDIPIIATGGVTLHTIREVLKAGATAVGLGNSIANKELIAAGRFDELRDYAAEFVALARNARFI